MKRPFSWLEFLFGLVVVFGIYYVSDDFSASEYLALIYGLLSAFLAALFAVINARLVEDVSAAKITLYEMFSASIFLSFVLFLGGEFSYESIILTTSDFFWLTFLGVVCTSFAFLATVQVVKHLGAFSVSLSINLEPVYTILLAIVILNEDELLNYKFYLGSLVIVAVVLINGLLKAKQKA